MQHQKSFMYGRLDTKNLEIRLIILKPASDFRAAIHCDLQVVSLKSNPIYEALSYVWGDAGIKSTIYLQGQPFQVTPNLGRALQYLRKKNKSRVLWADAISINQNDDQEKSFQVALMGTIYQSAQWDLLWLGLDLNDFREAFPILEYNFSDREDEARTEFTKLVEKLQRHNLAALDQLVSFFMAPVWQRMWIVQELVLAKRVFLVCGPKYLNYSSIDYISTFLTSPRYVDRIPVEAYRGVRQVSNTSNLSYWKHRGRPWDLLGIWSHFGWCKCLKPQDKIFAILNIASDKLGIRPDYSISTEKLFCNINLQYILRKRDLAILGYSWRASPASAEHWKWQESQLASSNPKQLAYRLPSWCADFGSDVQPYCARFFYERSQDERPGAWTLIPWTSASSRLLEKNKALNRLPLLGIRLDHVVVVTESTRNWKKQNIVDQYYKRLPRTIVAMELSRPMYFNGDTLHEAYWITVCAGMALTSQDGWAVTPLKSSTVTAKLESKAKPSGLKRLFGKKPLQSKVTENDNAVAESCQNNLVEHVVETTKHHVFCNTKNGYMALVPDDTKPGDFICVLNGGCTPFVLRSAAERKKEQFMTLIGPAFVHGFMDGLPLKWRNQGILKEQQFIIV